MIGLQIIHYRSYGNNHGEIYNRNGVNQLLINKFINESINFSIHQFVNQSNQSICQSINHLLYQLNNQSITYFINKIINQSLSKRTLSIKLLITLSMNKIINLFINYTKPCLFTQYTEKGKNEVSLNIAGISVINVTNSGNTKHR